MKTIIIAILLGAFIQGEQVTFEHVDYHATEKQIQFQIENAYVIDLETGERTPINIISEEEAD